MKKSRLIASLLLIIATLITMTACEIPLVTTDDTAEVEKQLVNIESPSAFLYENGVGGGDFATQRYSGDKFDTNEWYTKPEMPKGKKIIFGNEYDLFYSDTQKSNMRNYDIDMYFYAHSGIVYDFAVNDKTGEIVRYDDNRAGKNRDYKSPVNPFSSEKEFVEYASSILLEYSGISTEGWEVEVQTDIIKTSYNPEEKGSGFINYSEYDPEFNADYTITFYKTICGIRRIDRVNVKMNNTGEVISFRGEVYDEKYEPFVDAKIDADIINNIADCTFNNLRNKYDILSETSGYRVIPSENELWVEVTYNFKYQVKQDDEEHVLGSLVIYVIKVAELQEVK